MKRKQLFVCGVQRSGTTALANLLNAHSEICVCIERYKRLLSKANPADFSPDLFDRDRLLDFSDGYTDLTPEKSARFKGFYQSLHDSYDTLKVIGDKVPNSHRGIETLLGQYESCRVLFIVRDVFDTGCSWQARAEREGDGWPENRTADQVVGPWNECNEVIAKVTTRFPERALVVDYSAFFDGAAEDYTEIDRVTDFLGVMPDEDLYLEFQKARSKYASTIKIKPRVLSISHRQYIEHHANFDQYREIMAA